MEVVVLLRGVNVGGVPLRSAELARALGAGGFGAVRTVLASGNVVLEAAAQEPAQVRADVERVLREAFGHPTRVVVVRPGRLAEIAAGYPFAREDERFHPYCVFASDAGELAALAGLADPGGAEDLLRLAGDVLYWRVAKGSSTSTPFAKLVAAARWKPVVTTRNLRTVEKVLAVTTR